MSNSVLYCCLGEGSRKRAAAAAAAAEPTSPKRLKTSGMFNTMEIFGFKIYIVKNIWIY